MGDNGTPIKAAPQQAGITVTGLEKRSVLR
jgi:hypothetical protein